MKGVWRGGVGMAASGYRFSFQGDENILEFDSGDSCTTLWM